MLALSNIGHGMYLDGNKFKWNNDLKSATDRDSEIGKTTAPWIRDLFLWKDKTRDFLKIFSKNNDKKLGKL